MRAKFTLVPLMVATAVLVATACGPTSPDSSVEHPRTQQHGGMGDGSGAHKAEARIYAAASLRDVIGALAREFEPIRGSHMVASYGESNMLAQQLHEGAAPGVFVSASAEGVDRLQGWGLVEEGSRVDLIGNSLVVIVPKGAKDRPVKLNDLADPRYARIALPDMTAVPAGQYAKAALDKFGIFEALKGKIVAAQDAQAALAYVERGDAQVGIAYASDAAASGNVDVAFPVPSDLHPKIAYPMVVLKGSNRRARELYEFLKSETARAAFQKAGFTMP